MEDLSLQEILHRGFLLLIVISFLITNIGLVYFFARKKSIVYKTAVISCSLIILGIIWDLFHHIIHVEFKKIYAPINILIWSGCLLSIAYLSNTIIQNYLWQKVFTASGQPLSTSFLRSFVSVLVYVCFAVLGVWFVLHQEMHALSAFLAGYSFLLAYAASDIMKEILAGLALNINPAFKKGDFLKINGHQAKIIDINWRYVVLEDTNANSLFVPNTNMLSHIVYNYKNSKDPTRIDFSFFLHPNISPQTIIDLLMPKLKKITNVAPKDWYQDSIVIHIKKCDGHSVEFEVQILADDFINIYDVRTNAYKVIWETLNENGIYLFSYDMRVNLTKSDYDKSSTPSNKHKFKKKKEKHL